MIAIYEYVWYTWPSHWQYNSKFKRQRAPFDRCTPRVTRSAGAGAGDQAGGGGKFGTGRATGRATRKPCASAEEHICGPWCRNTEVHPAVAALGWTRARTPPPPGEQQTGCAATACSCCWGATSAALRNTGALLHSLLRRGLCLCLSSPPSSNCLRKMFPRPSNRPSNPHPAGIQIARVGGLHVLCGMVCLVSTRMRRLRWQKAHTAQPTKRQQRPGAHTSRRTNGARGVLIVKHEQACWMPGEGRQPMKARLKNAPLRV